MNDIRIHTQINSTTLHLPEVQPLMGKQVEIIVREKMPSSKGTDSDWNAFFAAAGSNLVEPNLVSDYREYDRQHGSSAQP